MTTRPRARTPKPIRAPGRARVRRGNVDDARQLRDELLAAAFGLFVQGGVDAVSMRAVAAQVGISQMTPYRYFSDKADLLRGLWLNVLQELLRAMADEVARHAGARARLLAALDAYLRYWEEHHDAYRLVYETQGTPQRDDTSWPVVAPVYADLMALVHGLTLEFAQELGVEPVHARIAGDIRFTMLLGYLQAALVNRRYPFSDRARLRGAYLQQVMATVERCLRHGPE